MSTAPSLSSVLVAMVAAYLIGSIPTAYLAARSKGVDIFKVGSGQAGATNVWRNVSRRLAAVVFFSDSTKGLVSLLVGRNLGLHNEWLLLPGIAVILSHWNSPWTKFRGGDGVANVTGVGLGLNPSAMALPYTMIAAITIGLNRRLRHPTLWGAAVGYLTLITMAFLSPFNVGNVTVNWTKAEGLGFTGLGLAILVHSYVYRRRRKGRLAQALIEAVQEEDIPASSAQSLSSAEEPGYKEKRA